MSDSADVLTQVTSALYSKVIADTSGFFDLIQGRFYEDQAPADSDYPYAVYSIISAPLEKTFSEEYTDILLQLSIFSSSSSSAEIKDIYYHAHLLFDDKPLTITGSTLIWMRETNLTTTVENITTPDGSQMVRIFMMDLEITSKLS